ncbi:hypothetical protein PENTCL1PPCAC_6626, partial [Pristionchus entomophagus]
KMKEGEWTGILGEIQKKRVYGSDEKLKLTSNRIREFKYRVPVVYSSDAYVIRERFVDKFTSSSYLVFHPLHTILFIFIGLFVTYLKQLKFNLRQRLFHPQFIYGSAFTGSTFTGGVDIMNP